MIKAFVDTAAAQAAQGGGAVADTGAKGGR
jgi:hypothetical protein